MIIKFRNTCNQFFYPAPYSYGDGLNKVLILSREDVNEAGEGNLSLEVKKKSAPFHMLSFLLITLNHADKTSAS